jgi:hypothetical protein
MKEINQKRGPTLGNTGSPSKRSDFMAAKASSGNQRSALATMVTDAVAARGRGNASTIKSSLENLSPNTNVGRGPRRGVKN